MNVIFTGDISFTGDFKENVTHDLEIFSDEILNFLEKSDFVVGNLEGPITTSRVSFNNNIALKSPVKSANYLKKSNINVLNLANNHILDFGEIGLKETLIKLGKEKIAFFGADLTFQNTIKPTILNKNDISIALFGMAKCDISNINNAQLFSSNNLLALKKQVKNYKKEVDFIFINFHGGEEFTSYPSPVKRNFLKKIAALEEVDCVIAHHSHTIQGYENHKNTPIFYSLGNFIFDIPNHKYYEETKNGALLQFNFTKNHFTFNFKPFVLNHGKIIQTDEIEFNQKFEKLSDFSNYLKKWQKEAYKVLFRDENPLFNDSEENQNSLQKKSFLKILFSGKFYKKTVMILKDSYMFSLYFHGILFKIKKKFTS